MRGVAPLVIAAVLVGIAAPVAATHDALDSQVNEVSLDVDDLATYDAFELLLLPDSLRLQMDAPLTTELPGTQGALDPNLDLLMQTTRGVTVPYDASVAQLPTPTVDDVQLAQTGTDHVGTTGDAVGAQALEASTSDQDDLATANHDGATSPADGDQAATTSTQSNAAGSGSGGLAEAWDEMSSEKKAAVMAGAVALMLIGPLTMYSRITRDETLENDTRREIYEIVEDSPGICIKDVADEAGVSYSTASYHLDRLIKADYLVKDQEGNKVLYYKNGGTFTRGERELIPILKNPECMAVFEVVLENPWCYRAEVAEALGVSHTTVNWHLKRLTDASLVEEHREGRNCHLYIENEALDRVMGVLDKLEEFGGSEQAIGLQEQAIPA